MGKAFWVEVLKLYHLEAPDLARLELACDALDVIGLARKKLHLSPPRHLALRPRPLPRP
jgi:hypothetical protein